MSAFIPDALIRRFVEDEKNLLDFPMPNGKVLGDCTDAELKEAAAFYEVKDAAALYEKLRTMKLETGKSLKRLNKRLALAAIMDGKPQGSA